MSVARVSAALWYLATALAAWAFGYTVMLGSDVWWLAAAAGAVMLGVVWLAPYPLGTAAFLPLTEADSFPVDTADFIEVNALTGNVFAHYRWGGYLHLRTQGRLQGVHRQRGRHRVRRRDLPEVSKDLQP